MRFSGIPQRPKPPTRSVAPLGISATASSADGHTLEVEDKKWRSWSKGGKGAWRKGEGVKERPAEMVRRRLRCSIVTRRRVCLGLVRRIVSGKAGWELLRMSSCRI